MAYDNDIKKSISNYIYSKFQEEDVKNYCGDFLVYNRNDLPISLSEVLGNNKVILWKFGPWLKSGRDRKGMSKQLVTLRILILTRKDNWGVFLYRCSEIIDELFPIMSGVAVKDWDQESQPQINTMIVQGVYDDVGEISFPDGFRAREFRIVLTMAY